MLGGKVNTLPLHTLLSCLGSIPRLTLTVCQVNLNANWLDVFISLGGFL